MKSILIMVTVALILLGGSKINEETNIVGTGENAVNNEDELQIDEMSEGELQIDEMNADDRGFDGKSADELLDLFADGKIMAYYDDEDWTPFYMTDLPDDPNDFTYCSVGDRVDLDNDGENELIINGPYGGIYLDAREGKVYVLDEGMGTAAAISYTEFDGQTWIVHSDTTHAGRIMYDFTLYDGKGQVVDKCNLYKEFWDTPDVEDGPNTVYTYRDEEITKEEYDELRMKMLGY